MQVIGRIELRLCCRSSIAARCGGAGGELLPRDFINIAADRRRGYWLQQRWNGASRVDKIDDLCAEVRNIEISGAVHSHAGHVAEGCAQCGSVDSAHAWAGAILSGTSCYSIDVAFLRGDFLGRKS